MSIKVMEKLAEAIPEVLQLDRLERLCKYHPSIAVMYAALITEVDQIILATRPITINEFKTPLFSVGGETYEPDFEGKLAAISHAFEIRSHQMASLVNATNIGEFVKAIDPVVDNLSQITSSLMRGLAKKGES